MKELDLTQWFNEKLKDRGVRMEQHRLKRRNRQDLERLFTALDGERTWWMRQFKCCHTHHPIPVLYRVCMKVAIRTGADLAWLLRAAKKMNVLCSYK